MTGTQPGLGRRLRQLRLRRGYSQTDLAGDTLSPSAVSLLESARREPTARTLELLAQRLGCTVEYLRDGVHPESGTLRLLRLFRAELALRAGVPHAAAEELREATANKRADPALDARIRLTRALVAEEMGDPQEAVRLLRDLGEGEEWLAVEVTLARCYRRAGQFQRAIDTARAALARIAGLGLAGLGEHAETVSTLMLALYEVGETAEALTYAREQLAGEPAPSRTDRAQAYALASQRAEELGRLTEALWLADRGLKVLTAAADEVQAAGLRMASASLLLRAGQAGGPAVRTALTQAHEVLVELARPDDTGRCEVELARAALQADEPAEAVHWAERALALLDGGRPGLPVVWARLLLAGSLVRQGQAERALAEARRVAEQLRTVPASLRTAEAWREVGDLLSSLDCDAAALDAFRQALAAAGVAGR